MSIIKCPKCHSTRVEKTVLGNIEQVGSYVAAATGIAALKFGASCLGLRTMTPSLSSFRKGTDEVVPYQYECKNCGCTFHERDY